MFQYEREKLEKKGGYITLIRNKIICDNEFLKSPLNCVWTSDGSQSLSGREPSSVGRGWWAAAVQNRQVGDTSQRPSPPCTRSPS